MDPDAILARWPRLSAVDPEQERPAELACRDDATSAALRAYLDASRVVPTKGELRL